MAMYQCPVCGREISDQAKKCPYCGYKLNKQTKILRSNRKIVIIIIAIVIIVSLCVGGGYFGYKYYYIPMSHYKKAEAFLKDDKFEKAVDEFEDAGNYKDAAEKIKETKYEWADSVDVDKAIALYKELGDYKDSKDKLSDAEKEKEKQTALVKLQTACGKCTSSGVKLSSDKKSIIVDSSDQYDYLTMLDILTITGELGLPDYLYDEMCYTNALMGRQSETFDYYEVSWSFHPDNGLDAIFKFID